MPKARKTYPVLVCQADGDQYTLNITTRPLVDERVGVENEGVEEGRKEKLEENVDRQVRGRRRMGRDVRDVTLTSLASGQKWRRTQNIIKMMMLLG